MISLSKLLRRSTLSGMTLASGLLLLTMLLSACGANNTSSGGSTPTATTNTATACSVSTSDLGPGGSTKGTAPNDNAKGTITIDGSSALQPLIKQAATEYQATNSGANITVNAGGSSKGVADVESGAVQIGDSDLFAQTVNATKYADLVDHQVAVVIFAVVVNPDVAAKITNLTTQQIQQIFSGQITNWSTLGGPNETITTVERPAGSGTRGTFSKYVMQGVTSNPSQTLQKDDSGALGQAVSTTPGAIGYIATSFIGNGGSLNGKITPVCIDGQKPSPSAVASNDYKFWNFEHMYTKGQPSGVAASFLNYVTSSAFQQSDLADLYFISASTLSSSATASHQP
ncbi:MAG TPA: phosphate ABC transporter substrate-binding protein [Ktedonobacterales bacterium]|nr:phosphate ABC transporter substrate-binding protein [Ktedonobacterales bacterium]